MRPSSITIDADGSPSGHLAWYNYSTENCKIREVRPSLRNDRFGVQRMEMLAIYFAVADNQWLIGRLADTQRKNKQLVINLRSDSKTSIEQLQGVSRIRDALIQRICDAIKNLLEKTGSIIIFSHLERTRNIAGLFLDQRKRRKEEEFLMHQYERRYDRNELRGFVPDPYGRATA